MRITTFLLAVLFLLAALPACRADTFIYAPKPDGTIARFHADKRTGELTLLPGATQTGIKRPVTLVLSANGRFLYVFPTFNSSKDGFLTDFLGDKAMIRAAETKPTLIKVFAVGQEGDLRHVETITVPGPVGQIACDPKGKFVLALTSGGAFWLDCVRGPLMKGWLNYKRRVDIASGMGLIDGTTDRFAWYLTFSPGGDYLYDFSGTGFGDHAENYLQRYRVTAAKQQVKQDGEEWVDREDRESDVTKPGAVFFFVNRTAFVAGFHEGCAVCPTDTNGRIFANGSHYL